MPTKKPNKGNSSKKIRVRAGPAYSKEELDMHRRIRGIHALAKNLKRLEVRLLALAIADVEHWGKARKVFVKIAKKHGVSLGDLEQALAVKLGPELDMALKDHEQIRSLERAMRRKKNSSVLSALGKIKSRKS
jgi:hypothetical protein